MWSAIRWLSPWWLVFVLSGFDATLGDGGIREYLHSFREVKCLQGYYSKTLWMGTWKTVHISGWIYCSSYGSWFSIPDWIQSVANFRLRLYEICVRNQWGHSCNLLVEDSSTSRLGSVTVRMEYLFAFQLWYSELCVENRRGGGRKYCFVSFCSLIVLLLKVG